MLPGIPVSSLETEHERSPDADAYLSLLRDEVPRRSLLQVRAGCRGSSRNQGGSDAVGNAQAQEARPLDQGPSL
jgi:hypothetical protein